MKNYKSYPMSYKKATISIIIEKYLELFNCKPVQYWTQCVPYFDPHGNLVPGSEFEQVQTAEIIEPDQFYGINSDLEIIEANQRHSTINPDNWRHGDFRAIILENPTASGIINWQTNLGPLKAIANFAQHILYYLDPISPTLAALTFRKGPSVSNEGLDELLHEFAPPNGWNLLSEYCNYKSSVTCFYFHNGKEVA